MRMHQNHFPLIALPLLVGAAVGCGGGVTLRDAVQKTTNGTYAAREPATSSAQLGHRLVPSSNGKQSVPDVNECYKGDAAPPATSWDRFDMTYASADAAQLKADFGDLLKVEAGAGRDIDSALSLTDLATAELNGLYFDPVSTCAETDRAAYAVAGGRKDTVIVREIKAAAISITDKSNDSAKLGVTGANPIPASAEVDHSSAKTTTWKGTELYFAQQVALVATTLDQKEGDLATGTSLASVGACGFQLDGVGVPDGATVESWRGSLTCDDGESRPLQAALGHVAGQRTGSGVSYGVRVQPGGQPGQFHVQLTKWVVSQN